MYIAILGRQPAIGIAELERVYTDVDWFSDTSALVRTNHLNIQRLGGTLKAGQVVIELPTTSWQNVSKKIIQHYGTLWKSHPGKITLGISVYGFDTTPRDVQKVGLSLKSKLKSSSTSLRLVPNQNVALNTATSHHNKLGLSDNKIELLVVNGAKGIVVAESTGAQNITALAARDQERPKRDAFVGMLPPKLAQIMINLAVGNLDTTKAPRILDPFCGTGVILQEAALMSYTPYGTDLSEKMIRYSRDNLNWLQDKYSITADWHLEVGDATDTSWQQPIDAVVTETYLGQPFSAPPSPDKLAAVRGNCNHIISQFLQNLAGQVKPGTPVVLAVPAWKDANGHFTHLPIVGKFSALGYQQLQLQTVANDQLLYRRPDQIVARELLILVRR